MEGTTSTVIKQVPVTFSILPIVSTGWTIWCLGRRSPGMTHHDMSGDMTCGCHIDRGALQPGISILEPWWMRLLFSCHVG